MIETLISPLLVRARGWGRTSGTARGGDHHSETKARAGARRSPSSDANALRRPWFFYGATEHGDSTLWHSLWPRRALRRQTPADMGKCLPCPAYSFWRFAAHKKTAPSWLAEASAWP